MIDANTCNMLKDIQILDFVLVDLSLYLDTHPQCRDAIEHYNHYLSIKNKLCKEFSAMYYPLSLQYADSSNEWRWSLAPLPWEGGF